MEATAKKVKQKYDYKEIFTVGIFKENPVFTLFLSMCSALGVTANAFHSVGLGVIVCLVLIITNALISIIGKYTPDEIRIPVYITVIASTVTIVEMAVQVLLPGLFAALGVFISLVVVNCIILGRAEAYAAKNPMLPSIVDGLGNGLGVLYALALMGFVREILATGALNSLVNGFAPHAAFELRLFPAQFALPLFGMPMGAFLTMGVIVGIITTSRQGKARVAAAKAKAQKAAAVA